MSSKSAEEAAATAHNPGQIVFYPILNLQQLRLDINEYIRTLEQIGIELLDQLGVKSERRKGFPGLWVKTDLNPKIASIGVRGFETDYASRNGDKYPKRFEHLRGNRPLRP